MGQPEEVLTPEMLMNVYGVEARVYANEYIQVLPVRPCNGSRV